MSSRVPAPSAIFVGRDEQLRRIEQVIARVPVAVIYGIAGVGKSMLAFSFAERWAGTALYQHIGDGELARLIGDMRRGLARGQRLEPRGDGDGMAEIAQRLDDSHALLVLDDLHRLAPGAQRELVHGIGQLLRRGRLIVTTRELPDLGEDFDHLSLRLGGLDRDAARALWTALDELRGPAPGFEIAWRRVQGNPLLLRRAHAGAPAVDSCAAALSAFTADERRVAGVLALANLPLPMTVLERLLPEARVRDAVRGLTARLIVDMQPDGACALHEMFRDELQRGMSADERQAIHAELARVLADANLGVVTRAHELCHHLGALDRFEDVACVLVAHGAQFIRHGAAGELLRNLEAIPKPQRTSLVQISHARTLGRLFDLRGAYDTLEQLLDAGTEPRRDVLLGFAPIAMLTGRLAVAERAFAEVLARHDLAPWSRVCAQFACGILRTYQGHGDDARACLRRAIAEAGSREAEGVLLAAEAGCFWLDDRDAEAAEPVRRASLLLEGCRRTVHGALLAPAALAVVLARLGRFVEAEPWLRQISERLAQSSEVRSRVICKIALASVDYERGMRAMAIAGFTEAAELAEASGDMLASLQTRTYLARLMLLMGQRRQALVRLAQIAAKARALGISNAVRAAERAQLLDPIVQLRAASSPDEPDTKTGAAVRARCMAALRAACDGDGITVAALLETNAPLTTGSDYALDRALGYLARAVLARARGDGKLSAAAMVDARTEARAGDVDPDVIEELDAELGRLRVVTGERTLLRASYSDVVTSGAILLDGRRHELHVRGRVRPLGRQAVLREILYALSGRIGRVVSKQDMAVRLWGGRYDPTIHDNRLWANIRRLRLFLADSRLNIEFVDDGYQLIPPRDFVFVEPFE
jgi:tetratricopeptide (TPR) repeat protein